MDTVLASLGLGTRYCLVSDDHERPESYGDDHERGPQTLLERCTDLGAVHDTFSRTPASRPASLLSRLRPDSEQKRPAVRRERPARAAQPEKENAGPRAEAALGLFDRLASRHGDGRLGALGGLRPGHRSDQGSAPLMTGDNGNDSWGWNSSPNKTSSGDVQWGSGAAWDDAQLAAPKTKAAKARTAKKPGGSDQASLIDLGDAKEDDWQSWEDDAWASLERKN
ncbi:uncharacterized protein LOC119105279 [Pollicipes pollicipes]|uniref:uncharacterized protein LOC119105279 n=1 Tax=Pollicipes pollicipes TaxID=41117 RepID=UPI0018859B51|nr:uncharacterized protein LOC119105279 [Pollicipes pollicipes]